MTIYSGLVNFIPLDHLQPRNMRGVKSCGMLMEASDAAHENVELLVGPEGSLPGDRIWFGSEEDKDNQPLTATENQLYLEENVLCKHSLALLPLPP